jgi:hypothetical protein
MESGLNATRDIAAQRLTQRGFIVVSPSREVRFEKPGRRNIRGGIAAAEEEGSTS